MRRHVPTASRAQPAALSARSATSGVNLLSHRICRGLVIPADRRHGILVRASCCEMFALTDSTLDFLVLQLLLQTLLLCLPASFLGFGSLDGLPVSAWSEYNILTHRRGIRLWTFRLAFLETELGPVASFSNRRVNFFAVNCCTSFTSDFYSAA